MRILVAAPPKTGNVWIEQLLSGVYGLNALGTAPPASPTDFVEWAETEFPDDSIVHQHYWPNTGILPAVDELGAEIVTSLRNPYDQFVSMYFYAQRFAGKFRESSSPVNDIIGRAIDDPAVMEYIKTGFRMNIEVGVAWLESGRSTIIRYEDLIEDPEATLLGLADRLGPADVDRVRDAIAAARPDRMRTMSKHVHAHVRAATSGDWRNHLSDAHLEAMAAHADLIEQLGYPVEQPRRRGGFAPFRTRRRRRPNRITKPFVVVSLGHTGATHVRYLLDSHPDIRCYGELFDPDEAYYAMSGLTDHHRYLAEFDPSENGSVVGFELSWESIRSYPQVLDLFHDARRRVLRVHQRNRLAQFVSAVAPTYRQYRQFGPHLDDDFDPSPMVRIDVDQCLRHLHDWYVTDRILDELLRHSRTLDVEYDELDDPSTQESVQRFLGVTVQPLASPMKRPPTPPLRGVIENWDEVESTLRGTVWEPFLDE